MSSHKPNLERKFLTGLDIVPTGATAAAAAVKVNPHPLVGTWLNADKSTGSIVKLILSQTGSDLFVDISGACTPTPCPWGKVKATAYSHNVTDPNAVSFTAHYDQGFADRTVTGTLFEGALILDLFTTFKDSSGRDDYYIQQTMYRP